MNRIKSINFTVKLLDVDYQTASPAEIAHNLGFMRFEMNGVADMGFLEELIDFLKSKVGVIEESV